MDARRLRGVPGLMVTDGDVLRVTIVGLNFSPEPTGIAPYTTRIATGLRERGHAVRVITAFPHYPQWQFQGEVLWSGNDQYGGVPVRRVRHYVPANPGSAIRRVLSETTFGLRATASRWDQPDVVLCPTPALISTAIARLRRAGRNAPAFGAIVQDLYSVGVTETGAGSGAAARGLARLESLVLRRADGISVIHERFRDRAVSALGVDPDRVAVIRNWTHIEPAPSFDRDAFRARLGWRDNEVIVLHAGAMGEKQALINVVAAARLAESRGSGVRFVLLGGGGQRAMLQEAARGCGAVEFRDPLPGDEYVKAMASADVLLVNEKPGVQEMAVPSKLTSYFSTGRPVLAATDPGSITAAEVEMSEAGVVVPAGDPAALVAAALRLGEDRHTSARIGANGPIYCETHLSESAALDAYDGWVRQLHAQRRTKGD